MRKTFSFGMFATLAFALAASGVEAQKGGSEFDVQGYKIDAELIPTSQTLRARAEVQFIPQTETRSIIFELNGSLTVKRITRVGSSSAVATPVTSNSRGQNLKTPQKKVATPAPAQPSTDGLQFIQDNRENMNVRIDLGEVVPAKKTVTLVFEYEGALESAQGGPISNARLAYVGEQGSYLFYAGRWFPFHAYVADRSTYQINIKVPNGYLVAGYSDLPVNGVPSSDPVTKEEFTTFTYTCAKPVLPGTFAAGKYILRSSNRGGFLIDFYVKAGDEKWVEHATDVIGKHLEFYSSKFGRYAYGNKLVVAETDEETLETYSGPGVLLISPRALTSGIDEKLALEVAYQWWGQAVGLKSFDDAWLWQGLSEFSEMLYDKDNENETMYQQTVQAELEKALAFEQSASIRNAPKDLDDQTAPYRSVVFNKGALVFNMLRQLIGEEKFDGMMRDYYAKFKGVGATLDDFEAMVTQTAGRDMRFFFGQWVESTGVPEFRSDYQMLRTKDGFRVPGTIKQDLDTFEMPVDVLLRTEAGPERQTLTMKGPSADFNITTKSKPLDIIVDPDTKIIRSSPELREGVIVRRGIENFREQEYVEAEQQFQAAIKLNRANSWAWYNLGLVYMTQRNWNKALDAFEQALSGNLRPSWVEVWSYIYRGNSWDAIGQRERAVSEYNKAINNGNNYDNAQATAQGYLAEPFGKTKKAEQQTGGGVSN